ncbi:MAG: hypothetical protein JKY48_16660 [Flavobacteriales bacterium]|nr:hypothetical protein [Flavobacteriales bacterium]
MPDSKKNKLSSLLEPFNFQYDMKVYRDEESHWSTHIGQYKKGAVLWFLSSEIYKNQEQELEQWLEKNSKESIHYYWLTDRILDLKAYQSHIDLNKSLNGNKTHNDLQILLQLIVRQMSESGDKVKADDMVKNITNITNNIETNKGFAIWELKSKKAPQINNHYYGKQDD